jgi:hypothetical protein
MHLLPFFLNAEVKTLNQSNIAAIRRRKSTPQTRAGQYMCPECGKVSDTKKEVDAHIRSKHQTKFERVTDGFFAE